MQPFIHGNWHFWKGQAGYMLSDESTKHLQEFADPDACINWLYTNGHKEAARALNKHAKAK